MKRRTRTLLVGAVPVVALASVLSTPQLAVPYASEGPGPLFDVLGDVDGSQIINVAGDHVDKQASAGQFNMTTVSVHHNLNLVQAMALWIDRENDVVPIEAIFPPGSTPDQVEEQNNMMFTESEANATSAALSELGLPMKTTVGYVMPNSSAEGVLEEGDVIEKVSGQDVDKPAAVKAKIAEYKPGDSVELLTSHGGKSEKKMIKLGENPDVKGAPMLGVGMSAQPAGSTKVEYKLSGIGGPSAGLMLSLGVVDKLSPGDLTEGHKVAGTGTIDASGRVGEIGGIKHKIAAAKDDGAEFFFVPAGNCAEALTADHGDMKLIQVSELPGALEALKNPSAAPACQ